MLLDVDELGSFLPVLRSASSEQTARSSTSSAGALIRVRAQDTTISDLVINDLRHTAASSVISSGAKVNAVQRMLWHTSEAMTLDVYCDLFEADLDAVADAIQAKLAAECGQDAGTEGVS